MYRFGKMLQRDFMNLLMNPTWLMFCLGFPFLLVTIIGFMTNGLYGASFTSYDYYGVTLMFYSALYTGTFSANSFMEERIKQANLRSLYTPISQWEIPLAKTLATFLYTLIFYTFIGGILMILFQVNYGTEIFKLWLLFAGINFASSSLGVLMCCIFKSEGVANQILSIITNVIAITAGLLFPAAALGETFSKISQALPLSKVIQVAFQLIYDNNSQNFLLTLAGIAALSLILVFASQMTFKGEAYL
ncbi:ABC transporter permease [Enterococcus sp. 669A]|uniref:ABC transporter permease n=1 Tax=Candidatus Enterococcus moelleringii TaxID=2815325 RepID=A0ABS3L8Z5_9ENTE|nr:ABC transporter permease [Enterococcus sp. 669A]MBO1305565.1 ABC transporter permease [Enterococcus sp. 669A]